MIVYNPFEKSEYLSVMKFLSLSNILTKLVGVLKEFVSLFSAAHPEDDCKLQQHKKPLSKVHKIVSKNSSLANKKREIFDTIGISANSGIIS